MGVELNKIYQGNALDILKTFPDECVDMLITSPPYWALRTYLGEDNALKKEEIGVENHFNKYITKLCDVFDEVKRVLKKEGTCWVNIGDTFYGGFRGPQKFEREKRKIEWSEKSEKNPHRKDNIKGIRRKCLLQIPSRFAIEMINRGWILRNEIIWYKPSCMPESVIDRFTIDFEKLYFFTKNEKYYFEQQFEKYSQAGIERMQYKYGGNKLDADRKWIGSPQGIKKLREGRNKRSVWAVNPKGITYKHYAVFPEELIEIPIKAGCPKKGIVLDPFFGTGTAGLVALKQEKFFIGVELNPEDVEYANKRLKGWKSQTRLS
jgi:DNA modification methylase